MADTRCSMEPQGALQGQVYGAHGFRRKGHHAIEPESRLPTGRAVDQHDVPAREVRHRCRRPARGRPKPRPSPLRSAPPRPGPLVLLGFVGVVGAASELDVVHRRRPARRVRRHVVKLQEVLLCAAAVVTHEAAAPSVARPDCPPDLGGDVARASRRAWARTRSVAPNFCLARSRNSTVRARSRILARSPSGIWWRRSACTPRSFWMVSASTVSWIR